jgi:hypothetical protein
MVHLRFSQDLKRRVLEWSRSAEDSEPSNMWHPVTIKVFAVGCLHRMLGSLRSLLCPSHCLVLGCNSVIHLFSSLIVDRRSDTINVTS